MSRAGPYAKTTPADRAEMLAELLSGWSQDWDDQLGKRPDGSVVWQVNAADVMLLVNEIEKLRRQRDDLAAHLNGISRQTAEMAKAHTT